MCENHLVLFDQQLGVSCLNLMVRYDLDLKEVVNFPLMYIRAIIAMPSASVHVIFQFLRKLDIWKMV